MHAWRYFRTIEGQDQRIKRDLAGVIKPVVLKIDHPQDVSLRRVNREGKQSVL